MAMQRFGATEGQTSFPRAPQHFLNFFPLPQGQGRVRPVLASPLFTNARLLSGGQKFNREGILPLEATLPQARYPFHFHRPLA